MLLCKFRLKKKYIYVDPHENLYIIAIGYTLHQFDHSCNTQVRSWKMCMFK